MFENPDIHTLMKKIKRHCRNRTTHYNSGFILPFSIVLVLLLTLVGYNLLTLGFEARTTSTRKSFDVNARAAADAGLTHAIYKLNKKIESQENWSEDVSSLNQSNVALPNTNAVYSFTITGTSSSGYTIQSTGQAGNASRTVSASTRLTSVFDFAIFMKKSIALYPNSSVEAFNSDTGATGLSTQIGVNSTYPGSVIVMNNATVDGDVYVGINGDPSIVVSSKGTITGDLKTLPYYVYFPEVNPPGSLTYQGKINNTVTLTPSESGRYSQINLGNSETITIDGGDVVLYVTGDATFNKSAGITVENGSTLTLYIDGDWESKNDGDFNVKSEVPANFTVYGSGGDDQEIDIKAKNDFYGVIYAPDADISIKAKGDIYGSIVGDTFEAKSKSTITYDITLSDSDIDDEGVFFAVENWREE